MPARGDVFLLKSGGQLEGHWLNRESSLQQPYHIETAGGLTLSIERAKVEKVVHQRPEELQYERLAPTVADKIDEQWKLAEWCRQRHLTEQRDVHLQRIIELDPEHLPARRALGYAQVDGQWLTRDQWRRRQGFEYYRGRWRLAQEIAIIEQRRKSELAQKQWLQRLRTWRETLSTDNAAQARKELLAIDDPRAVSTFVELLGEEPLRPVKLLYLEALGNIGDAAAVRALVDVSLTDPDEEVRVACLDQIEQLDPPGVQTAYVKALGNVDNFVINRAAYALSRLGDQSTMAPLIDALVTKHTFTFAPRTAGGPQTITTSFMNDQRAGAAARPRLPGHTGGLSMGSGKKTITRHIPNQEVLAALIALARGTNYGYDADAWRAWLESQNHASAINGRGG